ncbi:DUF6538 domain-containing protein [Celeribacter neptunius]|uniref:Site-specific recombinase XerD n=1 Tax=Celeribacter neptunius TaxID=588602 RepID=A0A1I3PF72_9RHOB|nr:tyrosine-type recombinase/integrase [Celeribacter neptunius]SFJ20178.1 Site-specific recombinase XerD [Celeribacter neptunius]
MARTTLPKGIFKRGNTYALRFSVPKELQQLVGKKEIVRSLGTSELSEALEKSPEVQREIKASLFGKHELRPAQPKRLQANHTVKATAHKWLAESDGLKQATRHRYQRILERFEKFSENTEVTKINRAMALEYIDHLRTTPSQRTGTSLSHRTLATHQICLASYWRVLEHWGLVDSDMKNPFSSLLRRMAGQKKKADPRRKTLRPVTRDEAEDLLRYIATNSRLKYQFEMFATVRLLWTTGCRLGEIAKLHLKDIVDHKDHIRLNIRDAKTEAGNRVVMLVGESDCELIREAVRRSQEAVPSCKENCDVLFPRIQRGGYDRSLTHYIGKALESARKKFPTCNEWDMHSFRRAAISALINASVPKEARNLVVGHSNSEDIGLSVYAKHGDLSEIIKSTFTSLYNEQGGELLGSYPFATISKRIHHEERLEYDQKLPQRRLETQRF